MASLPTPRHVLTSLINAIAAIPLQEQSQERDPLGANTSANTLTLVPIPQRHLIITLHVLFPALLLPALDLLDRRLVTRLILGHGTSRNDDTAAGVEARKDQSTNAFYLVRSAQPLPHHVRRPQQHPSTPSSAGRVYMVRLTSWNCTCEAFAFAAFPADRGHGSEDPATHAGQESVTELSADWSFGGTSADGLHGGRVPVCKHLLACLLAERWSAALGGYVLERTLGREEMAGIVADM